MTDTYSFEEVHELRSRDEKYWTFSRLAEKYGVKNESIIRKKYRRHAVQRGIVSQQSRVYASSRGPRTSGRAPTKHDTTGSIRSDKSRLEYHGRLDLTHIRKNIKYGELEPTLYKSDLDHLEWMRYYIGDYRYRYDLPHHRELQEMLWIGDKEVGLLPRGDGKTVTYLGMTPREIAEVRRPHVTITIPTRTKILFRSIHNTIIRSPTFRQDYGDIIGVEKGQVQSNKSQLFMWLHEDIPYYDTDPVYTTVSRKSENVGSRPYHLHFEDPTQRESDAAVQKLKEWYADIIRPMLSLDKSQDVRQTATTTRKHTEDFAAYLFYMGWSPFRYESVELLSGVFPSHNDFEWHMEETRSGELVRKVTKLNRVGTYKLLNPNWDLDELLEICAFDYSSFMSQYQNSPVSRSGNYFKEVWWKECEPFDITNHTKYLIADTAFGMKEHADYNSIGVWVIHYNKMHLVKNILIRNLEFDQIVQLINKTARELKVNRSWVHATLKEVWIVQNLRKRMPGVEPITETRSKMERINLLDNPWKLGDIIVFNDIEQKIESKNQWLNYNQKPSTDVRKDDFPDMCATAYSKLMWLMYPGSRTPTPEVYH